MAAAIDVLLKTVKELFCRKCLDGHGGKLTRIRAFAADDLTGQSLHPIKELVVGLPILDRVLLAVDLPKFGENRPLDYLSQLFRSFNTSHLELIFEDLILCPVELGLKSLFRVGVRIEGHLLLDLVGLADD